MGILPSCVFAAVSAVSYDGTAASVAGAVDLTLNDGGAATSLVASPADGGTVVVEGAGLAFAADAECRLATPGTLVFSNEVSAAGALAVGEDDADAEISYSGEIVSSAGYTTLFAGRRLADYDVKSSDLKTRNGCAGFEFLIGHEGRATAECVERGKTANGADRVRVLFQKWKEPHLVSVEMELLQQGDDIAGKALSVKYSMVNLLGLDLQKLFNANAKLSNDTPLVREQALAAPDRKVTGYGINQITLSKRRAERSVVFAGGVASVPEMSIAKGTQVEFTDLNANVGAISGAGHLVFSAARPREMYGAHVPKNEQFVFARNRSLSQISSMYGEMRILNDPVFKVSPGKTEIAKAYNIEPVPGDTEGWYRCQFQCLVNGYICCLRFRMRQSGKDIVAKSENAYGNYQLQSNGNSSTCGLGHNFYVASGTGTGIAVNDTGWGLALKNIVIDFKPCQTAISDGNRMAKHSRMTVRGDKTAGVTNIVRIVHKNGLPEGPVLVEENGILDIDFPNAAVNGSGVSNAEAKLEVRTNGLLRASEKNVLATYEQSIRLYGGSCEFGHGLAQGKDHSLGAGDLLMSDGARLFGSSPRVGFQMTNPVWRVTGNLPSVCDSGAFLMKKPNVAEPTIFRLYVEDVTKDGTADFVVNGALKMYPDSRTYDDITLRKIGDGTVLQNGYSEVKLPTEIWRGGWTFGKSGVSHGSQEFVLEGGTTLALASGVSNGLAKVTVKAPATLELGAGSLLTLDDLEASSGKNLKIEGEFGKGIKSVHVARVLPRSVLAYVRCEDGRVSQDDEGYLCPMPKVFYMTVR